MNKNEEPKKKKSSENSKPQPKWVKPVVITVAVLLALIVLIGGGLLIYVKVMLGYVSRPDDTEKNEDVSYEEMLSQIAATKETEETVVTTEPPTTIPYSDGNYGKTGKVINILLIGQDSRPGEDSKNSDTMILCSLNKETKVLTLSSFLRNSLLRLSDFKLEGYKQHNCGNSLLTFAYALGYSWGSDAGAFYMIDNTLTNNFGATIDHNIEINLDCFQEIIRAVGTIEVEMDEDEVAYMNNMMQLFGYERRFEVGVQEMYAESALIYARMRHATPGDNDMNRTRRQRTVISQVLDKLKKLSITEINDVVKTVLPYIITDMTDAEIATYLLEVVPVLPYLSIESIQIPMDGTYHGEMRDLFSDGGSHSSLVIDNLQKNRLLIEAVCAGTERPE